jgi:CRP/FNR family transcriptional regulator
VNPVDRNAEAIFRALATQNKTMGSSVRIGAYRAGQTICTEQEMAHSLFLVTSGRVQLYRTGRDGRRLVVATLGPGSVFGEASLLGGEAPEMHAVSLEPSTIWILPAEAALEISATSALFGFGLVQAMGQRVRETEDRLTQMAYSTVASRLAALLLELGDQDPQDVVWATHYELADMLGTWRETISKTLQDFRRRGWISSGRGRLVLLDRKSLLEASTAF